MGEVSIVEILLRARNETKAAFAEVEASAGRLHGAFASTAALGIGLTLGAGLIAAAKAASDFQTQLTQVQNNTTMTAGDVDIMRSAVLRMASESNAPLDQLTTGFMHITNLGFGASDAVKVLQAAMESATSTGGDTASVAETLALQLHEFGLAASQAGEAMDVLHLAAALGNSTLENFVDSTSKAVSMAANLHVPLVQVDAALSALSRHMPLAQASTALAGFLNKIVAPSKAAETELARLTQLTHIDLVDDFTSAGLATKGLSGVLTDLESATRGNQSELLKLIPATRGGLAAMVLMGTGARDYTDILGQLNDAMAGKVHPTMDAFARIEQTVGFQMGVLKNNVQILAINLGTVLLPPLTHLLQDITPLVEHLATWTAAHARLTTAILAGGAALGFLTAALPLLGAAIDVAMGPVGLLALAVVGLYEAWTHNLFGIQQKTQEAMAFISKALGAFVNWFSQNAAPVIYTVLGEIVGWWQQHAAAVESVLGTIWSEVKSFADLLVGGLRGAWNLIAADTKLFWDTLSGLFTVGGDILTGNWSKAGADLLAATRTIAADLIRLFGLMTSDLINVFITVPTFMIESLLKVVPLIGGPLNGIISAFHAFVQAVKVPIADLAGILSLAFLPFQNAARLALNVVTTAIDGILALVGKAIEKLPGFLHAGLSDSTLKAMASGDFIHAVNYVSAGAAVDTGRQTVLNLMNGLAGATAKPLDFTKIAADLGANVQSLSTVMKQYGVQGVQDMMDAIANWIAPTGAGGTKTLTAAQRLGQEIVKNLFGGFAGVPGSLKQVAAALGLGGAGTGPTVPGLGEGTAGGTRGGPTSGSTGSYIIQTSAFGVIPTPPPATSGGTTGGAASAASILGSFGTSYAAAVGSAIGKAVVTATAAGGANPSEQHLARIETLARQQVALLTAMHQGVERAGTTQEGLTRQQLREEQLVRDGVEALVRATQRSPVPRLPRLAFPSVMG